MSFASAGPAAAGAAARTKRANAGHNQQHADYVYAPAAQRPKHGHGASASSSSAAAAAAAGSAHAHAGLTGSAASTSAAACADYDSEDELVAGFVDDLDGLPLTQPPAERAAELAAAQHIEGEETMPPLEEPSIPAVHPAFGAAASHAPDFAPAVAAAAAAGSDPFGPHVPSLLTFPSWRALLDFVERYAHAMGFRFSRKTKETASFSELAARGKKERQRKSAESAAAAAAAGPDELQERLMGAPSDTDRIPKSGSFICEHHRDPAEGEAVVASGERPQSEVTRHRKLVLRASCPFIINFSFQLATGVYHVNKRVLAHTHPLHTPRDLSGAAVAITSLREVTQEMWAQVRLWLNMGVSREHIYRMLMGEFNLLAIDSIVFKNMLQKMRVQLGFGHSQEQVQALVHWMKQRHMEGDAFFDMATDDELRVDSIFYMTQTMRRQFIRNGQFLVLDATCNTNRFQMVLAVLVGIDENFNTVILAFALLKTESADAYTWMLGHVKRVVGDAAWGRVRTIATDGALSFYSVIPSMLPGVFHMRCRWHISMNITRNMSSKLGARFKPFLKAFRDVAGKPTPRTFQNGWDNLLVQFPEIAPQPGRASYMVDEIYSMKEQWADAWTNDQVTFGAHSTQRGEVMMSFIKRHLGRNSPLSELFAQLDRSSIHQTNSRNEKLFKQYELPQPPANSPLKDRLHFQLTSFAADYILTEYQFVLNYMVDETTVRVVTQGGKTISASMTVQIVPPSMGGRRAAAAAADSNPKREVEVCGATMSCTCGGPVRFLLPCRHVLHANFHALKDPFLVGQVHPRWTKSWRPPTDAPLASFQRMLPSANNPNDSISISSDSAQPLQRSRASMSAASRFAELRSRCDVVCQLVRQRPEAHDLFLDLLRKLEVQLSNGRRVDTHSRALRALTANDPAYLTGAGQPMESLLDPLSVQQIGAPVTVRYESAPHAAGSNASRGVVAPGELPIDTAQQQLWLQWYSAFASAVAAQQPQPAAAVSNSPIPDPTL